MATRIIVPIEKLFAWRDEFAALEKNEPSYASGEFFKHMEQAAKRATVLLEEIGKVTKLETCPVGDGMSYYLLQREDENWETYIWFWGGLDNWVSTWGEVVMVPKIRDEV